MSIRLILVSLLISVVSGDTENRPKTYMSKKIFHSVTFVPYSSLTCVTLPLPLCPEPQKGMALILK